MNKKSKPLSQEIGVEQVGKKLTEKDKKVKFAYFLKKLNDIVVLKENQIILSKKIISNDITIITGFAGTSKTFSGCYTLLKLLFEGKINKIILTKPIKESGENLGFLPGTVDEKILPYMESFFNNCKEMFGGAGEETLSFLLNYGLIECRPIAYMRGTTFNNAGMFLDEAQNCTHSQLMLYITRLGKNSKILMAGDITQIDINKGQSFLLKLKDILEGIDRVSIHHFGKEDIVRNKILIDITDKYEQWKEDNNIN